uniref:RXLR-class effector Avh247-like protein n=1 Tax=Phytophthora foliorum TaxID=415976 RepID=U5Y567_9STRA|nr:RXLR-class effector Avh247-like protein [Phytophthora foliorum]
MRLSHVLMVMAATFLLASEAFATTTDSNQAKIAQVTSPEGSSQRLLRNHPTTYEDDDSEERGGPPTRLERLNFKVMRRAGTTADDYAETLGIAAAMREVQRTGRGVLELQMTEAYAKYIKYFSYLKSKKKK